MEVINKEVRFDKYCKTCANEKLPETDEVCDFCLDHPFNEGSEKPINWKEKSKQ